MTPEFKPFSIDTTILSLTSAGLRPSREKLGGEGGCEDPKRKTQNVLIYARK